MRALTARASRPTPKQHKLDPTNLSVPPFSLCYARDIKPLRSEVRNRRTPVLPSSKPDHGPRLFGPPKPHARSQFLLSLGLSVAVLTVFRRSVDGRSLYLCSRRRNLCFDDMDHCRTCAALAPPRAISFAGAAVVLVSCSILTVRQLMYWRSSERIMQHAVAAGQDPARVELYLALDDRGPED